MVGALTKEKRPIDDAQLDHHRLHAALVAAGTAVYVWNTTTDRMLWSAHAAATLGLSDSDDIAGSDDFLIRIDDDDRAARAEAVAAAAEAPADTPIECEYRFRRDDGTHCWVRERLAAVGTAGLMQGTLQILDRRHQTAGAHHDWLIEYDGLTGHFNRGRLRDALDRAIDYGDRYQVTGACLDFAVDNLAAIHDGFGAAVADEVVVAVGGILDRVLRKSDVVGRIAEDRFGVMLNNCDGQKAAIVAEKILDTLLESAVSTQAGDIHVKASIGSVVFPELAGTGDDALARAKVARQRARAADNGYAAYDLTAEQRRDQRRAMTVAAATRDAMTNDRLRLAYQPVVASATHEVAHYEALLRMIDADGGVIGAHIFIPVAEELGLIRLLDRRVVELVAAELTAHSDITIALNVSTRTTADPRWLRTVMALFGRRPELAQRLMVEITETAALADVDETVRFVAALQKIGCRVALDDFGAGHTNFRHLKALAVDVVKIDGAFVLGLAASRESQIFVKTLQDLADGFGLITIAECVEDDATAQILVSYGVDFLQGYHFGAPSIERPWSPTIANQK